MKRIDDKIRQAVKRDIKRLTHRQVAAKYNIGVATVSEIRNEGNNQAKIYKAKPYLRITAMPKYQINWLAKNQCRHGISYLEHQECFIKEHKGTFPPERIAFLDIEASNLAADFGIMLCYCIKPSDSRHIIGSGITKRELSTELDKALTSRLINDLRDFDRVVGHYSSRFDLPFVRARAAVHGLDFPHYSELYQSDTWRILRTKFKFHSNRLDNVGEVLGCKVQKTKITPLHWLRGLQGRQESLDYIYDHCRRDVLILEEVWRKIYHSSSLAKTSI